MRVKTVKLPDGSKGPTIVMLKEPKLFLREVSVGESFEVDDSVGYALMAKNPGMFELAGLKAEATDVAQVKMTRKVQEPTKLL